MNMIKTLFQIWEKSIWPIKQIREQVIPCIPFKLNVEYYFFLKYYNPKYEYKNKLCIIFIGLVEQLLNGKVVNKLRIGILNKSESGKMKNTKWCTNEIELNW